VDLEEIRVEGSTGSIWFRKETSFQGPLCDTKPEVLQTEIFMTGRIALDHGNDYLEIPVLQEISKLYHVF
jgi:hypothetical protein